ncbi:MAG: HEPN domain-containing protein [Terriglobia bacterium]
MDLDRAQESLKAAELCLQEGLINSAANRAYYAIFQAAHVAMSAAGFPRKEWSHYGLQAGFTTELIHHKKLYPGIFRDYLSQGFGVRRAADYGLAGVSKKIAQRLVHRATAFVTAVEERVRDEITS